YRRRRLPLHEVSVSFVKEVHVRPVMSELNAREQVRQQRIFVSTREFLKVLVEDGRKSLAICEVLITCSEGPFGRHLLACSEGNTLVVERSRRGSTDRRSTVLVQVVVVDVCAEFGGRRQQQGRIDQVLVVVYFVDIGGSRVEVRAPGVLRFGERAGKADGCATIAQIDVVPSLDDL